MLMEDRMDRSINAGANMSLAPVGAHLSAAPMQNDWSMATSAASVFHEASAKVFDAVGKLDNVGAVQLKEQRS